MSERYQVYKCNVCGIIVETLVGGAGTLSCCNKPMKQLKENTVDAATEKHVPVIEKIGEEVKVKVGSVEHPMEPNHFIEWIEVIAGEEVHRQFLSPGQKPEATFKVDAENLIAREHCNLHGLWKAE